MGENMIPFILLRPHVLLIAVVVAKRKLKGQKWKPKGQKRQLKGQKRNLAHSPAAPITTAAVGFLEKMVLDYRHCFCHSCNVQ